MEVKETTVLDDAKVVIEETTNISKKDLVLDDMRAGLGKDEIMSKHNLPKSTYYNYLKQVGSGEPDVIPPSSQTVTIGKAKGNSARKNIAIKPLNPDTCATLIAGAFGIFALWQGPGWNLDAEERKTLGNSLSDCLVIVPDPVGRAVAKYSAPMVFGGQMVAVVQKRLTMVAELKSQGSYINERPAPTIPRMPVQNVPTPPQNPNVAGFTTVETEQAQPYGAAPAPPPPPRLRDIRPIDNTDMSMAGML